MTALMRRHRSVPRDEGAALILVLVFIGLFALLIPGIIGLGDSTLRATQHNSDQRDQQYASESALKREIVRLRDGVERCGSKGYDTSTTRTNGVDVTVTCQTASSVTTLASHPQNSLQAVTSDPTEGVIISPDNGNGGGNAGVTVFGNVASRGIIHETANGSPFNFTVHDGNATGTSCVGNVVVDAGFSRSCNQAGPGDPDYPGPSGVIPPALPPTCSLNAAVFSEGYYSAPPVPPAACQTRTQWFQPGTYYFDFLGPGPHVWDLSGKVVVGGTPYTPDFDPNGIAKAAVIGHACRTEFDSLGATVPPGVMFVFGNDSRLNVNSGALELCPSYPVGSQAIAVYGAKSAAIPVAASLAPTTASSNDFTNQSGGRVIGDGQTATYTLKNNRSVLALGSLAAQLPSSQSVVSAQLSFAHKDADNLKSLSLSVTPGGGIQQTFDQTTGVTLNSSAQHTDVIDVSTVFPDSTAVNGAAFTITAAATKKDGTVAESLDGLRLDVQYLAAGQVRSQAGCVTVALSGSSPCYVLDSDVASKQAMHGTVYAPLGAVRVGVGSQVDYDRGVVARTIELDVSPGHGNQSFGSIQTFGRSVVLTASVGGATTAKAVVLYRPNPVSQDAFETVLSWQTFK